MADLYKQQPRKKKGYSFYDGKLNLGNEEQVYGPQNDPNATPVEKAGLINPKREQKAEKAWNEEQKAQQQQGSQNKPTMDEETGEIKLNGANQAEEKNITPNATGTPEERNAFYSSYDLRPNHKDPKFKKNKEEVANLQQFLLDNDYLKSEKDVDGAYGPGTDKAYKQYKIDQSKSYDPQNAQKVADSIKDIPNVTIKNDKKGTGEGELTNGGGITPLLAERSSMLLTDLGGAFPDINFRVTAGNDKWHQDRFEKRGRYSIHQEGNSLDFTVVNPWDIERQSYTTKSGKKRTKIAKDKDGKYIFSKNKEKNAELWAKIDQTEARLKELQKKHPGQFTFINEYKTDTGGNAPHFHIEAKDPEVQRALGDTSH